MGNRKQEIIHSVTGTLFFGAAVFALFLVFVTEGFECWLSALLCVYCFGKPMLDTEPVDHKRWNAGQLHRKEIDENARNGRGL